MSDAQRSTSAALRYDGTLAVVSACSVVLFLAYGRVFSVALLPPFGRAATTLGVAGLAIGGLVALLWRGRFAAGTVQRLAGWVAAFGFAAPFCQIMVVEHVPVEQAMSANGVLTLAIAGVILCVPFLLAGVIGVATMLAQPSSVHRRWAAVSLGAAVGALVAVVCLRFMPATLLCLLVGGAGCWLALLLAADGDVSMRGPLVAGVAVLLLGVLAATQDVFRFYHVRSWDSAYTEEVAWTVDSRLGVFPPGANVSSARTLPLAKGAGGYPGASEFKWLDVDGAGWMPMLRFDGDLGRVSFLLDSVVYAAHRLRPDANVLVVGVGGGRDLLAARAANPRKVVGIERNPLMRRMVDERFGFYSGRPYALENVEVLAGAPRRLLPALADHFDVVQLGPATSGTVLPFLDDEGYLYTREAFRDYFRLLTPRGLLSVSRPYTAQNPLEVLRLLSTVRDAWRAEGVVDPSQHLVVLLQELSATVLARREPFGADDLAAVDRLAAELHMTVAYDPRKAAGTDDATMLVGAAAPEFDAVRYDVRATTDDWPFFSQLFRSATATVGADPFGLLAAGQAAFAIVTLLAVAGLGLAFVVLAVATLAPSAGDARPPIGSLVYFVASGWGAVALALPVLERLRLLAGSDVVALVAGACGLGLAGAAGSVASARLGARSALAIAVVLGGVAAVLALALPRLHPGASAVMVVVLAIGVLVPVGAMLGMLVPLGLRSAGAPDARLVAAGLAVHAAGASAALAAFVAVAMRLGMSGVVGTAAVAFGIAAACLVRAPRRAESLAQDVPAAAAS